MVQMPVATDIIDAHVHFWHPDKVFIPWVSINPDFNKHTDAERYSKEISPHRVAGAVYVETDVEPTQGLVEADWICKYAESLNRNALFGGVVAIVAYAPVNQGVHVRNYLRLLSQLAGERLRGVRYLIQDPALDPQRVLQPEFVQGIQVLEEFGLSFDLNINCRADPAQFPPLVKLVAQCPNIQFILDHMAKPPCDSQPGSEAFEYWKENIFALAQFPNVACKVSGLVTETNTPTVQQLKPFVQVVREAFGADRLMFGGDWPVCEGATRWRVWFELLTEIVQDWSDQDRHALFVSNAKRIYRIK